MANAIPLCKNNLLLSNKCFIARLTSLYSNESKCDEVNFPIKYGLTLSIFIIYTLNIHLINVQLCSNFYFNCECFINFYHMICHLGVK